MKRTFLLAAALGLASGCVAISSNETKTHAVSSTPPAEMKIAFDITEGNPQALATKLAVIDLTRKQLIEKGITPKMVLAFRGDASYYTQANLSAVKEVDRADAIRIAQKLKELKAADGVESLEQCNVPLASRKLKPEDVMSEVKVVPNGWIALVGYQQKGYAYIAP